MCLYVGEREGYGSFTIVFVQPPTNIRQITLLYCTLRIYQRYQCFSGEKKEESRVKVLKY